MLKILIGEDHVLFREGLVSLLNKQDEIQIIGEASDGLEVIQLAKNLNPDIILMDLNMPVINGIDAIKTIKSECPEIKIIAVTAHDTGEYVRETLKAGVNGYVLKIDTHKDLSRALEAVQKGNIYLSPVIREELVTNYITEPKSEPEYTFSKDQPKLTAREKEITELIASGLTNKEIGRKLEISLKTVEKHRANLMKKLNLKNASAVTKYAIENKLLPI